MHSFFFPRIHLGQQTLKYLFSPGGRVLLEFLGRAVLPSAPHPDLSQIKTCHLPHPFSDMSSELLLSLLTKLR